MNQNRDKDQGVQGRSSNMDPAEGSRDTAMQNESMRNRESGPDLGTSSDRAMFSDDLPSERARDENSSSSSSSRSNSESMRGSGSSGERNRAGGGISNRDLEREQAEQDQLPERGRSQSDQGDGSR